MLFNIMTLNGHNALQFYFNTVQKQSSS